MNWLQISPTSYSTHPVNCLWLLKQVRQEESERFKRLVSIPNEFDPSLFEGLIHDDFEEDALHEHPGGRQLLQAANILASEQDALLQFKRGVLDPNGILAGWNGTSNQDHCEWVGILCSNITSNNTIRRVVQLNITGHLYYMSIQSPVQPMLAKLLTLYNRPAFMDTLHHSNGQIVVLASAFSEDGDSNLDVKQVSKVLSWEV